MDALLVPTIAGRKLTLIAHDAPTASCAPHVVDTGNAPGCAPVTEMLFRVKTAFPVFANTIDEGGEVDPTARL